MNFLLRQSPSSVAASAAAAAVTSTADNNNLPPVSPWLLKSPSQTVTTLEGLIAVNKSLLGDRNANNNNNNNTAAIDGNRDSFAAFGNVNLNAATSKDLQDKHLDVKDDQGWITIPFKKLPDDWSGVPDIQWFHSVDRSFVFPGEQVHIVACLSASKQDAEIITPFKVDATLNKNGVAKDQTGSTAEPGSPTEASIESDDDKDAKGVKKHQVDVPASESYLKTESHTSQTQILLQRFKDSHFFVRIDESGEHLWSDRSSMKASEMEDDIDSVENNETNGSGTSMSAVIDSGRFDARASGGVARNSVKCCSLPNGDVVVLLQVNVGVDSLRNPVLEILQFEKYDNRTLALESDIPVQGKYGSCGELLKWLLPLDNSQIPINRPLSPPLHNPSHKTSFSASGGSPLFSFGHFRSHSMSSLPQVVSSPSVSAGSRKSNFDLENWDRIGSQKSIKSPRSGNQGLMSFRGVPLEPERFSVCCGLEGIYIPGRRWRKQLEIIQPVDIHSFAANCNIDDLLCVQIKNICPAHVPDIVVYVDAITIILEAASKAVPPLSIPVACIEAGTSHSLPNLALRSIEGDLVQFHAQTVGTTHIVLGTPPKFVMQFHSFGPSNLKEVEIWWELHPFDSKLTEDSTDVSLRHGEEHSFILKPAISALKKSNLPEDEIFKSHSKAGNEATSTHLPLVAVEGVKHKSTSHDYAVIVSCRSNYSESRLFFKKPTDWRPRISRDFMISVASEISKQTLNSTGKVSQLPVQVLNIQASNLTSEDLTLILLAPASFTPPPSVLSLNSSPTSTLSPFSGFNATQNQSTPTSLAEKPTQMAAQPLSSDQQDVPVATASSCTHQWLHSRVPLGCVPPQSSAKITLELLPLTDGIITLDTLQIYVKEKGLTYIPEHALKINATSSIATGII